MPDLDLTLLDKFHLFHLNLSIQLDSLEGISTNDDETKINLKKTFFIKNKAYIPGI